MKIRIKNLRELGTGGYAWTTIVEGGYGMDYNNTADYHTNRNSQGVFCGGAQIVGTCDFSLRRKSLAAARQYIRRWAARDWAD